MAETSKSSTTAKKPAAKKTARSAAKPKVAAKPKAATKTAAGTKAKTSKAVAKKVPVIANAQSKMVDEIANLKDKATDLRGKATDKARSAAETGKERASEAVGGIGKLLRETAATIDDNVGKSYGDYARNAADAVDGFAQKMDAKQVDEIVSDARDFVRKSPAVAIGAAAAIGFVLVRLMRSGRDDA